MAKKILRINMSELKASYEAVPEKWSRWAGRAMTSAITCDEVDPMCHPLGPNNKVIISPGWVTGSPAAPSEGRTSCGEILLDLRLLQSLHTSSRLPEVRLNSSAE